MKIILLDSGPLGVLCNPKDPPETLAIRLWLYEHQLAGNRIVLSEAIDYENRREYEMNGRVKAIKYLDFLRKTLEVHDVTADVWRQAALFWADVRRRGQPTADRHALDIDVILSAHAQLLGPSAVVATDNAAHITRLVPADPWAVILP